MFGVKSSPTVALFSWKLYTLFVHCSRRLWCPLVVKQNNNIVHKTNVNNNKLNPSKEIRTKESLDACLKITHSDSALVRSPITDHRGIRGISIIITSSFSLQNFDKVHVWRKHRLIWSRRFSYWLYVNKYWFSNCGASPGGTSGDPLLLYPFIIFDLVWEEFENQRTRNERI